MKDRSVEFSRRRRLVPIEGQEGVYDVFDAVGTVYEAGSPLNKANLLSDATATLYGLTADTGNVDKALEKIPIIEKGNIVEIKNSMTYTVPNGVKFIDVFLVGAGGAGGNNRTGNNSSGGGGGYTKFIEGIPVTQGQLINCIVGVGGIAAAEGNSLSERSGGKTIFGVYSVNGGVRGFDNFNSKDFESFGGSGGSTNINAKGGSNGDNCENSPLNRGIGQKFPTTCPFDGRLFAGGGGYGESGNATKGGDGGGGNGGSNSIIPQNGMPNTGGGGGGYGGILNNYIGGNGGSGIIIIRERMW